eukprot:GILI01021611.1.p1 GENE.GILI01021611.1~~GILI01021611.1.p1  ORF type:complete len:333 (-),score=30.21 GILI01021611.1:111-1109(-)
MTEKNRNLVPENANAYWTDAWDKDLTGWKAFEKDRGVFGGNIELLENGLGKYLNKAPTRLFDTHKSVLIPLCGDTYATRYFADEMLATAVSRPSELKTVDFNSNEPGKDQCSSRCVVGVDLAMEGIKKSMNNNFPEVSFEKLSHDGDENAGAFTHFFAKVASGDSNSRTVDVHLFTGDLFKVCQWWASMIGKQQGEGASRGPIAYQYFDFCYDRASMVAMHPSLRKPYVDSILSVFPPATDSTSGTPPSANPLVFLELVVRTQESKDRGDGPPFHIEEDSVAQSADDQHQSSEAKDTFYPHPWRRLTLKDVDASGSTGGRPFNFKPHVLFIA